MIATAPAKEVAPLDRLLPIKSGGPPYVCENTAHLPDGPLLLQRAIVETPNNALLWLVRRAAFIADQLDDEPRRPHLERRLPGTAPGGRGGWRSLRARDRRPRGRHRTGRAARGCEVRTAADEQRREPGSTEPAWMNQEGPALSANRTPAASCTREARITRPARHGPSPCPRPAVPPQPRANGDVRAHAVP